ncbi:hypothetical protein I4U23_014086 [Adineta vaga]|nr:hypothetical protein I4U23_014086 [Adineta vaga]
MENENRVDEYLQRIELNRPNNISDEEYLIQLHIGHLTHIPFETFDLIDLKELNIELDYIFERLVRQKRGGVCYQMNGLFAFILQNFNYKVQLIPCGVYWNDKDDYFDDYSHLAICVTLKNGEQFLCDVGFSMDSLTPLFFRKDCIQYATNGFYRLTKMNDQLYYKLEQGYLKKDVQFPLSSTFQTSIVDIDPECISWRNSYRFRINFAEKSTKLEDFQSTCPYIVHSPDVFLNHYTVCHLHTCQPTIGVGAYAISGKEYCEWIYKDGHMIRTLTPLSTDESELKQLLKEKFNLIIERKIELVN